MTKAAGKSAYYLLIANLTKILNRLRIKQSLEMIILKILSDYLNIIFAKKQSFC